MNRPCRNPVQQRKRAKFLSGRKGRKDGSLIIPEEGNRIKNAYLRIVCRNSAISNLFLHNMARRKPFVLAIDGKHSNALQKQRVVSLGFEVPLLRQTTSKNAQYSFGEF
ncbi:hypothetical protein AVEN_205477-1 [Araneus ventricosus]|uniref:Uncharacterized protein n=1 Tax=Araneus ventricosus TaxID=182803 RepID=A0A4Y2CC17_ARAVE|nr:hypothetical protein AVEN_205477-1 [Araneus ventricosus]